MTSPADIERTERDTQRLTFKFRLRDKHSAELNRQARAVNFVWNFLNETQQKACLWGKKWPTAFDFQKLAAGSSKELDIFSTTIDEVCRIYARNRDHFRRPHLRWRSRRSLGWVPFKTGNVKFDGASFTFRDLTYWPMHYRRELTPDTKIRAGSFSQDARRRWYLNISVEVECALDAPVSRVGIDLGLRDLATLSNGDKVAAPHFYQATEKSLATVQRSRKSKRARNIHAKIANRRKDFLHKATAKIAKEFGLIVIGDVSPKKIAQTDMAKSSLDAGWSDFKRMLAYKSHLRAGHVLEVSERYTSQACSACGCLPASRPKGIASLGIREWSCDECGAVHDRDVNAARNILARGLASLVEGACAARRESSQFMERKGEMEAQS